LVIKNNRKGGKTLIKFQNVSKCYGHTAILKNISFDIKQGEFVVLIGPSGCGKTTTLKTINRLIEPDNGKIFIDGKDITKANPVELRRTIGYVIQQIGLFPNMTVEQNISIVPKLLKYPKQKCQEIVQDLLALVDMPYEENAHKYPTELSGGQQQRIGVLRALAASPPIILMDEPFGALDPITRDSLQEEIKRIQKKLKKTIVFVTHDMDEALRLADTIIFMNNGKIVQMASPEEMLQNPADSIIKSFLGKHMDNGNGVPKLFAEEPRTL
jgi:osmoprotectant transport system ATP-binding protein